MHASIEQLLSLSEGGREDTAGAQHVRRCAECRDRLARLGEMRESLRALPQLNPPAGGWTRLQARLDMPKRNRPGWLAGAMAAAVLAAMALWTWTGNPVRPVPDQHVAAMPGQVPAGDDGGAAVAPNLATLVSRSHHLEQLLRDLNDSTPHVMNAGTAGTIAGLQDSIAFIDYGLSHEEGLDPLQSEQLWRQRVGLMNTLVQVRGAQLQQISD